MLMLIELRRFLSNIYREISIHLMLMLIYLEVYCNPCRSHFNTSHVNVNHTFNAFTYNYCIDFNTSHVNVNRHGLFFLFNYFRISIHLMLMLILLIQSYERQNIYFNTSHVNVNH